MRAISHALTETFLVSTVLYANAQTFFNIPQQMQAFQVRLQAQSYTILTHLTEPLRLLRPKSSSRPSRPSAGLSSLLTCPLRPFLLCWRLESLSSEFCESTRGCVAGCFGALPNLHEC